MSLSSRISTLFEGIKTKYETMMDKYKSDVNAIYRQREGHDMGEDFDFVDDEGGENQ